MPSALELAVRRRLPGPVKVVARRALAAADPLAAARYRRASGDPRTLPGRTLRARVGVLGHEHYVASGRRLADDVLAALAEAGRGPGDVRSLLDFGCGPGRLLDALGPQLPAARLTGCDVDTASIAWAARHRPDARYVATGFAPPLPFEDGEFDAVCAISVFTHLTARQQDAWLPELLRVLAPDGVGVLTVLGQRAWTEVREGRYLGITQAMTDAARELPADLEEAGIAFVPYEASGAQAKGSPDMDDVYGLTFHGRRYVEEHWGAACEVLGRREHAINANQDAVLVRRRPA